MLLRVQDLSVDVATPSGPKSLVRDVSLNIGEKRVLALVGGSGSGKTTTALAALRLLAPPLSIIRGKILFKDEDLLRVSDERLRGVRGQQIGMVFQEPLYALNPVFNVGAQIEEVLRFHARLDRKERQARVFELLQKVGISEPQRVSRSYPHQLSGGMRQRAMIAQAIALNPKLIIADEPTSNLDVTVQARILELFEKLKSEMGLSILLITHDFGLVKFFADEVAVMDGGRIVESGPVSSVLAAPQHEYTGRLLKAAC